MYTFRSSPQGRHHFQAFHSVPISQNSRTTVYLLVKSRHLQKPILKLLIRVFTIVKTSVLIRHDAGLLNSAHQPWIHSENPTQDTDVIWLLPIPLVLKYNCVYLFLLASHFWPQGALHRQRSGYFLKPRDSHLSFLTQSGMSLHFALFLGLLYVCFFICFRISF